MKWDGTYQQLYWDVGWLARSKRGRDVVTVVCPLCVRIYVYRLRRPRHQVGRRSSCELHECPREHGQGDDHAQKRDPDARVKHGTQDHGSVGVAISTEPLGQCVMAGVECGALDT